MVDMMADNYIEYVIESPLYPMNIKEGNYPTVYFPTPFGELTQDEKEKIVNRTRKLIDTAMKSKPERFYIDLRGNLGGDFFLFYFALYPLLPEAKVIITGVDHDNQIKAEIKEEAGNVKFIIDGFTSIERKIPDPKKYKVDVYVRINPKSMSSSQLIAIMFIQAFSRDRVLGVAPANYTNGSVPSANFDHSVVFPYYMFRDLYGNVYDNGV